MSDTVLSLRRAWSSLECPRTPDLGGDWRATFVAPLRRVAPVGLGLIGLPRWYGKRFTPVGGSLAGVNLLRQGERLVETMPMQVTTELSRIDDRPAVVVSYAPGSRKPWPWVVDELRVLDAGTLVGMTIVDVPGARALGGTPFLLHRD